MVRRTVPPIGDAIILLIDQKAAIRPPKVRQLKAIKVAFDKDSKTGCRIALRIIFAMILDRV